MYQLLLLLFFGSGLFADITAFSLYPKNPHPQQIFSLGKITVLDSKRLFFNKTSHAQELSALAYKNGCLYALSDKGYLIVFNLVVSERKIKKLTIVHTYKLRKKDAPLKSHDSEGLAYKGKNLLISFERKEKVALFNTKGVKISNMKISTLLQNKALYQSKNKGLESVAYNKKYGIITAPELPLKGTNLKYHRVYSLEKIFQFTAEGSITGLEFINKDTLLVLLRDFQYFPFLRKSSLVALHLNQCTHERVCKSELLATFSSDDGYDIDNFEGVTRVGKNRFLMVSDDNNNFFQKTLLVLFEIRN